MKKPKSQEKSGLHVNKNDRWLQAIEDYELRISQYRRNILDLRRSIKVFKENSERAMPWPEGSG